MKPWKASRKHLKYYPHFDPILPLEELEALANNPRRVASNPFYPFLFYTKSWIPYRGLSTTQPKERPIRYGARKDAAIFSRYRELLSQEYELALKKKGLNDVILAYRKIPVSPGSGRGKCNIHFAKDAIDFIRSQESCSVIVADISSYFDRIDHCQLYQRWCDLFSLNRLPDDHFAVYRAITKYAFVEITKALRALGHVDGSDQVLPFSELPTQLCTPEEFRNKIAGKDPSYPRIIQTNRDPFGIPQGAPISDVLANLYLIDVDEKMHAYMNARGGIYRRYSDDILIALPGHPQEGLKASELLGQSITSYDPGLKIKPEKSIALHYTRNRGELDQSFEPIKSSNGKNGIEYLGFRYDGRRVFLKDGTLSRFYRKLTFYCRYEAHAMIRRYPGKDLHFLNSNINFSGFERRFGRVEEFDPSAPKSWTFWSYVRRASQEFGRIGQPILKQVSGYRGFFKRTMKNELHRLRHHIS